MTQNMFRMPGVDINNRYLRDPKKTAEMQRKIKNTS